LLQYYLDRRHTAKKDRRRLGYTAHQVTIALDEYVSAAAAVIGDAGEQTKQGAQCPTVDYPQFDPKTIDIEWTVVPEDLAQDLRDLPRRTKEAIKAIDAAAKIQREKEALGLINVDVKSQRGQERTDLEERAIQFSELGLHAANLAARFRQLAKLHGRQVNGGWDPVHELLWKGRIATNDRYSRENESFRAALHSPLIGGQLSLHPDVDSVNLPKPKEIDFEPPLQAEQDSLEKAEEIKRSRWVAKLYSTLSDKRSARPPGSN